MIVIVMLNAECNLTPIFFLQNSVSLNEQAAHLTLLSSRIINLHHLIILQRKSNLN